MLKRGSVAVCGTLLLAMGPSGCGYLSGLTPEAAHENFLRQLSSYLGSDIRANIGWTRPQLHLSTATLAGGQLEYRFKVLRGCIVVFEVDPASNLIVRAGHEGTKEQCMVS